jgi:exodeoxyribonuclease VII small subunit
LNTHPNKITENMPEHQNQSFESQLSELEELVRNMASSQLDLEKALSMFEQGSKLSKNCQELLTKAEQKVRLIRE